MSLPAQEQMYDLEVKEARLAQKHLRFFVERAWSILEPTQKFIPNWHIDVICDVLEQVTRRELTRVIINVPPGTMKSLLVSVFWPAWEWATDPTIRYLCASYGQKLATRDNLKLRDVVTSEWYQRHFDLVLTSDQNAKEKFNTSVGGWRIATSVKGAGTGEHPDSIVIDDPHSAEEARSDQERQRALYFHDRTLSPRGATRNSSIVLIMQRLHENDLTGHLMEKGGWEHVMFPMRFDPERADPRDPRTEPGELLWPDVFTEAIVRKGEMSLGPYGAAGQYQQRPAPEGGGLFQREWFEIVDAIPSVISGRCRGWDTGATFGGGDWTAGARIARNGSLFFVEDMRRVQLGPEGVNKLIAQTASLDGPRCRQVEEQEPGSAGVTVIAARTKMLAGYDYMGVRVTGDKVTRARPFRAQCEAGNVKLLKGPWNEAFLSELEIFPNGAHDDQVDATSAAFNELTLGPVGVRELEVEWG